MVHLKIKRHHSCKILFIIKSRYLETTYILINSELNYSIHFKSHRSEECYRIKLEINVNYIRRNKNWSLCEINA